MSAHLTNSAIGHIPIVLDDELMTNITKGFRKHVMAVILHRRDTNTINILFLHMHGTLQAFS